MDKNTLEELGKYLLYVKGWLDGAVQNYDPREEWSDLNSLHRNIKALRDRINDKIRREKAKEERVK